MTPAFASNDKSEILCGYGIVFGYPVAALSRFRSGADGPHVIVRQLGRMVLGAFNRIGVRALPAKHSEGVNLISSVVGHFKIAEPVVGTDAAKVVDHQPLRNLSDKRLPNEPVGLKGFDLRGSGSNGDDNVPVAVSAALNDPPSSAHDPAFAGDLVSGPSGEVRPSFRVHTAMISQGVLLWQPVP